MSNDEDRSQSSIYMSTMVTSGSTASSKLRLQHRPESKEIALIGTVKKYEMFDQEEDDSDVSFSCSKLRGHFSSMHDHWNGEVGKQFPFFVQTTSSRSRDERTVVNALDDNIGIVDHITRLIDSPETDAFEVQMDGSETEDVTETEEEERRLYEDVTVATEAQVEYDEVTVTTFEPKEYEEVTVASDARRAHEEKILATDAQTVSEPKFCEFALTKEDWEAVEANLALTRPISATPKVEDVEENEFDSYRNPTMSSRLALNQKCNPALQCLRKETKETNGAWVIPVPEWNQRDCTLSMVEGEKGHAGSFQACQSNSSESQKRDGLYPIQHLPLEIAWNFRRQTHGMSERSLNVLTRKSFPSTKSSHESKIDIDLEPNDLNTGNEIGDGDCHDRRMIDSISDIQLDLFSQRRAALKDLHTVQRIISNKNNDGATSGQRSDDLCLILYKAALQESEGMNFRPRIRGSSSLTCSKNGGVSSYDFEIHAPQRGLTTAGRDLEIPALHRVQRPTTPLSLVGMARAGFIDDDDGLES